MVEKFLVDLFSRFKRQKVAIVIDGEIATNSMIESFHQLVEKLREVGDIKIAEVIYENKLPEHHYEYLSQTGFTNKIVPGNIDLNLLLETYDLILSEQTDFVVIGSHSDKLIPLYTEIRKTATVFAYVENTSILSKAFVESFDGIISSEEIAEYSFSSTDFEEFDTLLGSNGSILGNLNGNIPSEDTDIVDERINYDESNIGTFSEDLEDQPDKEEDVKHQTKVPKKKVKKKKKLSKSSTKGKKQKETILEDKTRKGKIPAKKKKARAKKSSSKTKTS